MSRRTGYGVLCLAVQRTENERFHVARVADSWNLDAIRARIDHHVEEIVRQGCQVVGKVPPYTLNFDPMTRYLSVDVRPEDMPHSPKICDRFCEQCGDCLDCYGDVHCGGRG
jgi:hypothetical protein